MIGRDALSPRRLIRSEGMTAFRHRNYRLFFGGQSVSLIGTWMQQVAQAWLVLQLTQDPIWLGIVAAAQYGPVMAIGLFAGVAADALPKRRVLVGTQVAMLSLAAVLAALVISGTVEIWMILALAFVLGCVNAIEMPVRHAFAIELVDREDIGNAVALNSAMLNGARVVGPAAAGLAIAAFGVGPAFVINAISFVPVILGLHLMDEAEIHLPVNVIRPASPRAVLRDLREGLSYVRRTPAVLLSVAVVGSVATVGMNFNVLIPPFAQNVLGTGAAGYGFLMAASGIGSLIAAMRLVFGGRPRPIRLATGSILLGVASLVLALTREVPVAMILMFLIGFGSILMAATGNTTIQMTVPDHLRGRVMSVYTTVFSASVPIGGLAMGAIASWFGVPVAIAVSGALTLAVGGAAFLAGRDTFREAVEHEPSSSHGAETGPAPGIAAGRLRPR